MNKRWRINFIDEKKQQSLMKNLNISATLAEILVRKNLDEEQAKLFLNPENIPYYDPFLLKDMDLACARLKKALKNQEKICIYGDYDVDGVSSTALLMKVFSEIGFNIDYYLPDRHSEGYGLHINSLDKLISKYDILLTVDCGITAIEEVAYAKNKIDIIITDHHLPLDVLPNAIAVVNPNQKKCNYPNKFLCGVGVAYKLCQALYQMLKKDINYLEKYLDIVALGTVADIVPLLEENRRIVKKGLSDIQNIGIKELLSICGYNSNEVNTGHIGFGVAPRLNAAGRLTHASMAVELLLATDKEDAHKKGLYLDNENKKRQEIVETIFKQAVEKVEKENLSQNKVIVVVGQDWHEGVIGITASRLQERYYRPIVIIAVKDNIGKASCRSIDGFHMKNALSFCADDFVVYGGHSKAAGFTIEENKIDEFIKHIQLYAKENLKQEYLTPVYDVETVIYPEDITKEFIQDLAKLEPFGMANPKPQFVCENLFVNQAKTIGKEHSHLRFSFEHDDKRFIAVYWNMAQYAKQIENNKIDILFQPELNHWNNKDYIQFKINDLRLSSSEFSYFEKYPSYENIGKFYLLLRKYSTNIKNNVFIIDKLISFIKKYNDIKFTDYMIKQCLQILAEINLLAIKNEKMIILNKAPQTKIDINSSKTFIKRYDINLL